MDYWMQTSISKSKKLGVQGSNSASFWLDQAMLHRDRLFRLYERRHAVTNEWGRSPTSSGLFLKKNSTRWVPLQDIWQKTSCYNLMFQRIEARAERHWPTSESADWPQEVRVFYNHQEVNLTANKVGRISIGVQLCDQLPEWQKKWQSRCAHPKIKQKTYRRQG